MDYGPISSGTSVDVAQYAFSYYFGFKNTSVYSHKSDYSDDIAWKNVLKQDLSLGRPILYGGTSYGTSGIDTTVHAWVIDGYNTMDNFHCNWGNGGAGGYFPLTNLTPQGTTTNYKFGNVAILNLEPFMPNCVEINGPSIVCSSGARVTVNNPLTGSTVLWEKSDNLIEVSGQGTTAYTVKAYGGVLPEVMQTKSLAIIPPASEEPGSSGWVRVTISNNYGNATLSQKNVWVGFPGFKPVVTGPTSINCGVPRIYLEQNSQAIYWSVPSSMTIIGPSGPGFRCTVKGLEFAAAGVIGTVSNACGSFTDILEVDIECSTFSFFPNPASTSIDVTITDGATNTASVLSNTSAPLDDVKTYAVRITNAHGVPFYTTQKTGNCFTLPVDKLKDGIYILQVIDGINTYNKQLVVKH
jgi:hypothetical protein